MEQGNKQSGNGYAIDSIDEFSDIDTLQISKYSIPSCDVTKLRAIRVDGKSMLQTLMPDEYVIIDIEQKRYVGLVMNDDQTSLYIVWRVIAQVTR